jgi:hypothetical protein
MVRSIGVYTEMLSAPLATVTAATDQGPVATTGESSSEDEERERIAEIRQRGGRRDRDEHRDAGVLADPDVPRLGFAVRACGEEEHRQDDQIVHIGAREDGRGGAYGPQRLGHDTTQ